MVVGWRRTCWASPNRIGSNSAKILNHLLKIELIKEEEEEDSQELFDLTVMDGAYLRFGTSTRSFDCARSDGATQSSVIGRLSIES